MKSYIIYDMDGVIIDSEGWYLKELCVYLNNRGYAIRYQQVEDAIGLDTKAIFEKLHPYFPKEDVSVLCEEYYRHIEQLGTPNYLEIVMPEIQEVFLKIKQMGIDIVVASSSPRETIKTVLQTLNLDTYVTFYLGKEDITATKPNPEIYLKAIAKSNQCLPIVAVEDSTYGIAAAKAAGIKVLAYDCSKYKIDQSQCDKVIHNHKEVLTILETYNTVNKSFSTSK